MTVNITSNTTESGYTLSLLKEDDRFPTLTLWCMSVTTKGKTNWLVSQLMTPYNGKPDVKRLVVHWLNFYEDSELTECGSKLIDQMFGLLQSMEAQTETMTETGIQTN